MRLVSFLCCAALLPLMASAADPVTKPAEPRTQAPSAGAPPPPPLPKRESSAPSAESGLEPEVTITTRGDVTHQEYRLNGKLYMIKVIPKQGKPYYLVDKEGNGQLRRNDIESDIAIPQWVIKSW